MKKRLKSFLLATSGLVLILTLSPLVLGDQKLSGKVEILDESSNPTITLDANKKSLTVDNGRGRISINPGQGLTLKSLNGRETIKMDSENGIILLFNNNGKLALSFLPNGAILGQDSDPILGIGGKDINGKLTITGRDNNGKTAPLNITSGDQSMLIDGNEIDAKKGGLFLNHNSKGKVSIATGGGNVGIGMSNPTNKLSVKGVIESSIGGIKFPDGSIQNTAQLRGPAGEDGRDGRTGPPGPPGPPVSTSAVCVNASENNNGSCGCSGLTVSKVNSPCQVTSDTGSCSASGFGSPPRSFNGQCCVCGI